MQMSFDETGAVNSGARGVGLTKPNEDPRLTQLLALHESVLKRLGQKQRELSRFNEEAEGVRLHLVEFLLPIEEEGRRLDEEIHKVFETLLAKKKYQRVRAGIEALYRELQILGTISERFDSESEPELMGAPQPNEANPYSDDRIFEDDEPARQQESATRHRGGSDDRKDMRALFLKLAEALHPDKVQDDEEKARRTELMKDLNRAYQDGDVAKILEIEAALSISGGTDTALKEDDIERRCRVLENQYCLLQKQYRELLDELLEVRRSMLGEAVIEARRNRRARAADPYRTIIEPMEQSIAFLQGVHDHVASFAAGEISVDEFLDGPLMGDESQCDCPDCVAEREEPFCDCPQCTREREDEVLAMLQSLMAAETAQASARQKTQKAKKARKQQKASRKKNRKR